MTRWCTSLLLVAAAAVPAQAHFVWVLPGPAHSARIVFSDRPRADDPALLQKIAHSQLTARSEGKEFSLKAISGKGCLEARLPAAGVHEVAVVCPYGVLQPAKSEPFLLQYYAKTFVGLPPRKSPRDVPESFAAAYQASWDKLPLEIVPVPGTLTVRVLWQGQPLAGAEYVLLVPGEGKPIEGKTDAHGEATLVEPRQAGLCGMRVKHTEARSGELAGKTYKEVRHYATLTLALGEGAAALSSQDPEATRLLAEARAARALYQNFPGFTADVKVNLDGKVAHGQVAINSKGKVQLELAADAGEEARRWTQGMLASIISHRLDSGSSEEAPCTFVDEDLHHPLGRAIRVAADDFHSSYRVRDRQILVVNRQMKDVRFSITMLENHVTEDRKFLPVSFVVNTWDLKTNALKSSEAHHQTWHRLGGLDLPQTALVVTATAGKQQARSLTLSNWKLAQ
jgi:hypothetical protein